MQNARREKKFGLSFFLFHLKEPLLDFNWKVKVGSTSRFFDFVWIGFKSFSTFEPLMRAMTVRTAKIKKKLVCVWERKKVCVCVRACKTGSKSVWEKGRERESERVRVRAKGDPFQLSQPIRLEMFSTRFKEFREKASPSKIQFFIPTFFFFLFHLKRLGTRCMTIC